MKWEDIILETLRTEFHDKVFRAKDAAKRFSFGCGLFRCSLVYIKIRYQRTGRHTMKQDDTRVVLLLLIFLIFTVRSFWNIPKR
jgi:hypothetical protein